MSLEGKVALVTGGSRGIGRGIVEMLCREGCHVSFSYHWSREKAETLAAECARDNVRCSAVAVDVRDFEAVRTWVNRVKEEWGRLDILVNNAGIVRDKPLMMMTPEDWREVVATNLDGAFHATRACIVTFMKQKAGRIVTISSVSGLFGLPGQTNYSASKGALHAFTKALAKETAAYGVQVNAVAPGFIETDMLAHLNESRREQAEAAVPLGRLGRVEDVVGVVQFLLKEASYITGQVLVVDGGLTMR